MMFGKKSAPENNTQTAAKSAAAFFGAPAAGMDAAPGDAQEYFTDARLATADYLQAKQQLTQLMLERVDFANLDTLADDMKRKRIREAASHLVAHDIGRPLTAAQVELLKNQITDDLLGFGPIEVLMNDPGIADIMINGHRQVYIERDGRILRTDITFASEKHLLSVIQKIVAIVGRRIDESSPMVDARMPDGSRFNAVIPPLALDGCLVSIRKFRKQDRRLADYVALGSMSEPMRAFLEICAQIRLNVIISGGTGSGKTTLLNALSGAIDPRERIVTIEDTAELQLQQPHVLRMEVRPPNMEGAGEIGQRQLMRNALRMRPDRIIVGEIRGDEVVEMLSAMNTGHDGSMATIHANGPRDALSRLENLISMSKIGIAPAALRQQIASAVHLVVQVARLHDGSRRITQIDEVYQDEQGELMMQTLFEFRPGVMGADGRLAGTFHCTGARPHFMGQAAYFGKDQLLLQSLGAS